MAKNERDQPTKVHNTQHRKLQPKHYELGVISCAPEKLADTFLSMC